MGCMSENTYIVEYSRPENERAGTHLVLLLHGYGSHEKDLLSLAEHLPQEGITYAGMRAPAAGRHPVFGGRNRCPTFPTRP